MTINAQNLTLASTRLYEAETSIAEIARTHGLDPAGILDFSLNANPFGPPASAVAAARAALADCNFYPDVDFALLRSAVAKHYGLRPEGLFFGAGLDDIIKLLLHAWTTPGDAVLVHLPTFPRYALEAGLHGCRVIGVESAAPERTDIGRLRAALSREAVALAFICTPNNPTGEAIPAEAVEEMARAHPDTLFLVDEALIDPAKDGMLHLPDQHPNVVVLRTFSKFFGLAGLRIGFATGAPDLIRVASVGRPPFNLALPSVSAAAAALEDDTFLTSCRAAFAAANAQVTGAIGRMPGVSVRAGHANMLLLDVTTMSAGEAATALAAQGIVVADATSFQGLESYRCLRVSLRGRADNDRLIAALASLGR